MPPEHPDHFAVVIGLSAYPKLGPPPANLRGPDNDATSVANWLRDPAGGGLPEENVKLIRSQDFTLDSDDPKPTRTELEKGFLWLDDLAKANLAKGKGRTVGTRLYLYVSGHGFSPPGPIRGCLLAANVAEEQFSANVFPSGWIEWLQDAGYFREYVLWLDCCMDRRILTVPAAPPLDPINTNAPPPISMFGFAAPRNLRAVEVQIPEDGGNWHGIFTWNLVQGLRGAASTSQGVVTTDSLENWLRQAQLAFLETADRADPSVAKEPVVVKAGGQLVLARGVSPMNLDVTLQFPPGLAGRRARLWSGDRTQPNKPPTSGNWFPIVAGETDRKLLPGLYLVEVENGALRQGFAVTRAGAVAVSESGAPPAATDRLLSLDINPGDATASIRITGAEFEDRDIGSGRLKTQLPFGLYQVRIQVGRQMLERVLLLDVDQTWPQRAALDMLPEITSAAPLDGTRTTHEYQVQAAYEAAGRSDLFFGSGAELMVMTRFFTAKGTSTATSRKPWDGVELLNESGTQLAEFAAIGSHDAGNDPVSTASLAVSPGTYRLRYDLWPGGRAEQGLVLPPGGWRLESYLMYGPQAGEAGSEPRVSLLMRRSGSKWNTPEDLRLEKAKVALADERPILNDDLRDVLLLKFDNPLAGIIGGHLLLISREHGGTQPLDLLDTAVGNLRGLVGTEHPDVEALSLECQNPALRRTQPIQAPPMFERSWRMLVKASQDNPQLVPRTLWDEVHAAILSPPFLVWAANAEVQSSYRAALAEAVFGPAPAKPEALPDPTKDLPQVPMDIVRSSLFPNLGPLEYTSARGESSRVNQRARALGLPPVAVSALRETADSARGP
jgi:hypothetical protein